MFNINVFNQCENSEDVLMTIDNWRSVHPLLKTIPVEWSYTIPFACSTRQALPTVKRFLSAVRTVLSL